MLRTMSCVATDEYSNGRPTTFDERITLAGEGHTLEEWWWRYRTGIVEDGSELAIAIIERIGVDAAMELNWCVVPSTAEENFRSKLGLSDATAPPRDLSGPIYTQLAKHYAHETAAAFDHSMERWLADEPRHPPT